jgi:hypothetical protein
MVDAEKGVHTLQLSRKRAERLARRFEPRWVPAGRERWDVFGLASDCIDDV